MQSGEERLTEWADACDRDAPGTEGGKKTPSNLVKEVTDGLSEEVMFSMSQKYSSDLPKQKKRIPGRANKCEGSGEEIWHV